VKDVRFHCISSLRPRLGHGPCLWAFVCATLLALVAVPHALAVDNGLGRTPAMGWNSWNHYGCGVSESIIKNVASTMASNGMKAAGYEYVNLDDCWMASSRTSAGALVADPTNFPDGMAALASYVHSLGLKIGLYEDVGTATCQGRPGSYGHYAQDIATYQSWGIDYIKMDWCNTSGLDPQTQYTQFEQALTAANAQIYFSLCEWGVNSPWNWAPAIGNSWRTTGDISDNWGSMTGNLESSEAHASAAGPGAWNDPDMLEVGNGGMTDAQDQAHFAMWAMSAAPLIAGNNVTSMSSATLATLTNKNIVAVDQDPLGIQATIVDDDGAGQQVWVKKLSNGTAVALFNNSGSAANITANWTQIGLSATQSVSVTNLWTGQNLGNFTGSITENVPSDYAVMLLLGATTTGSCTATAIAPYMNVGGVWIEESSASVTSTAAVVDLGPQPVGGTWSWTGPNGFVSNSREIDGIPLVAGTNAFVATYTNSCGSKSTRTFTVTAPGGTTGTGSAITPYLQVNAGAWQETNVVSVAAGSTVNLGPQPIGGTWSWTGPNGFTSNSREIDGIPLTAGTDAFVATYTNASGAKSVETFTVTVTGGTTGTGNLIANGAYVIASVYSGLAIADPNSSTASAAVMEQLAVTSGTNELWTVNNLGNNVITLTNGASGQLLDVTGQSTANGALVDQYPANGQNNQKWNVVSLGGGHYELTSVNSGLALEVVGGVKTAGAELNQYTYSGNAWQQWSFTAK